MLSRVIAKNVGDVFLRHTVVVDICTSVQQVFNLCTGSYFLESTFNCQMTFLNYTVSQKTSHLTHDNDFVKFEHIS